MKSEQFDVFVIGSGSAGKEVVNSCVEHGMKVAIADNRAFGGTCALRGCDPKKVLLGASETYERFNKLKGKGISGDVQIDWKELQNFKNEFIESVPKATEKNLKEKGVKLYHQSPHFLNENDLLVEGKKVSAKKIVIATGQIPRPLDIAGSNHLQNSDDFLNLEELPKSIAFVGGGYIAMEFAHLAARAGSEVIIIENSAQTLNPFDEDLVKELEVETEKLGITIIHNAEVKKVEKLRKNFRVYFDKNGKEDSVKSRMVFNTSGRVPAIEALDLEKGNVAFSEEGVKVNSFLQSTTNPNVYACGDVATTGLPLTPLASIQGSIAADNIIKENSNPIDLPVIPSVVFTIPQLATVGMSESEAKSTYKNVRVNYEKASDWFNAKRINANAYSYKILINERTDIIVGAHLLGPEASEVINLFSLAIEKEMTMEELKRIIFTYPTWGNDIKYML
jgi:glutathione reductase (NADPH)